MSVLQWITGKVHNIIAQEEYEQYILDCLEAQEVPWTLEAWYAAAYARQEAAVDRGVK